MRQPGKKNNEEISGILLLHVILKHFHKGIFYAASPFIDAEMIEAKSVKKKTHRIN